jgi:hypothetical protein
MLSTTALTASIFALLGKSSLSAEEQIQIEGITTIAQERKWSRQRAAYWLHCQAFPKL